MVLNKKNLNFFYGYVRMKSKKRPAHFDKTLGNKIRILRQLHEMTQVEVADALGYESSGILSLIESGKSGMKREKIYKAAELFGVHPAVLMSPQEFDDEQIKMFIATFKLIRNREKSPHYQAIKALLNIDD